jgi:hypothetical protein
LRIYGFLLPVPRGWRQDRQRDAETLAKVQGGVVGRLLGGPGPEVEGVARAAAFEAVENLLVQVGGEAPAGAGGGAVPGARAALLGAAAAGDLEAEQLQDGGHRDGGADDGEIDGRTRGDRSLALRLLVRK